MTNYCKPIPILFRCFYPGNSCCDKVQVLPISDISHWIECYLSTHPDCVSVSVKVWTSDFAEVQ